MIIKTLSFLDFIWFAPWKLHPSNLIDSCVSIRVRVAAISMRTRIEKLSSYKFNRPLPARSNGTKFEIARNTSPTR